MPPALDYAINKYERFLFSVSTAHRFVRINALPILNSGISRYVQKSNNNDNNAQSTDNPLCLPIR